MKVKVDGVTYHIKEKAIINDISLTIQRGEIIGVIGPNGSGKSTFLKTVYRVLKPCSGMVTLDETNIYRMSSKQLSQKMAVVSQETNMLFDFSVMEMVMMGRSPHKKLLETYTHEDQQIVMEALEQVGMEDYADRSFLTLSGGEKQRVMIARTLAQKAEILILDEPTNHLDIHHQLQILDVVKGLNLTVMTALHDLNLASSYCDRILVLNSGSTVAFGTPEAVLTKELLADVFRVITDVKVHPITGKTHITFLSESMLPPALRVIKK